MSKTLRALTLLFLLLTLCVSAFAQQTAPASQKEEYLWTAKEATKIGRKWRVAGRVGWGHVKWELFTQAFISTSYAQR